MKNLQSYIRLIILFFKTSVQQEISFRFDFMIKLLNTILALAGSIGGIAIVFTKTKTINGWDFYNSLAVLGMFLFIQNVKDLVFRPSLDLLAGMGGELWKGGFDFILLKPVPTQFYISVRKWAPLTIIDLTVSIVIIVIAIANMNANIGYVHVIFFILTVFTALLILYSILLILSSVAFWYLGTLLLWVFDSFIQMGRYPVKVYPFIFRNILTWIIPVGLIISLPVETLSGRANILEIILGMIFGIVIYVVAVLFLKASIKKYSSASS